MKTGLSFVTHLSKCCSLFFFFFHCWRKRRPQKIGTMLLHCSSIELCMKFMGMSSEQETDWHVLEYCNLFLKKGSIQAFHDVSIFSGRMRLHHANLIYSVIKFKLKLPRQLSITSLFQSNTVKTANFRWVLFFAELQQQASSKKKKIVCQVHNIITPKASETLTAGVQMNYYNKKKSSPTQAYCRGNEESGKANLQSVQLINLSTMCFISIWKIWIRLCRQLMY